MSNTTKLILVLTVLVGSYAYAFVTDPSEELMMRNRDAAIKGQMEAWGHESTSRGEASEDWRMEADPDDLEPHRHGYYY